MQYYPTGSLTKGSLALVRMYDSLPDGTLKAFITEHCAYLHTPLTGDTPVHRSLIYGPVVKASPTAAVLGDFTGVAEGTITTKGGVYTFVRQDDPMGYPSYAGKSSNVHSRHKVHCRALARGFVKKAYNHPFYADVGESNAGSFKGYSFITVFEVDNYRDQYLNAYPEAELSHQEASILGYYTDQLLLSVEQAYSVEARPLYFKGLDITVKHANWQPGYNPNTMALPTRWTFKDGSTRDGYSPAINQAVSTLGRNTGFIKRYANCHVTQWVETQVGLVSITVDGLP